MTDHLSHSVDAVIAAVLPGRALPEIYLLQRSHTVQANTCAAALSCTCRAPVDASRRCAAAQLRKQPSASWTLLRWVLGLRRALRRQPHQERGCRLYGCAREATPLSGAAGGLQAHPAPARASAAGASPQVRRSQSASPWRPNPASRGRWRAHCRRPAGRRTRRTPGSWRARTLSTAEAWSDLSREAQPGPQPPLPCSAAPCRPPGCAALLRQPSVAFRWQRSNSTSGRPCLRHARGSSHALLVLPGCQDRKMQGAGDSRAALRLEHAAAEAASQLQEQPRELVLADEVRDVGHLQRRHPSPCCAPGHNHGCKGCLCDQQWSNSHTAGGRLAL